MGPGIGEREPLERRTRTDEVRLALEGEAVRHDLRHTCASLLLAQGVSPTVVMEASVTRGSA
jgi:integrase